MQQGWSCPACGAPLAPGEAFCSSCGHKVRQTDDELKVHFAQQTATERLSRARNLLLAVAILTAVQGAILFFSMSNTVESQLASLERELASMATEKREELLKERVGGMTFDEIAAHDRGQVRLILVINFALAAIYLALRWWAKRNAVTASIVALLLFVTVHAIDAFIEPKNIANGIILKVAVVVVLISAVSSALKARREAALLAVPGGGPPVPPGASF